MLNLKGDLCRMSLPFFLSSPLSGLDVPPKYLLAENSVTSLKNSIKNQTNELTDFGHICPTPDPLK